MKIKTYTTLLAYAGIGALAIPAAHSQDLVLDYPIIAGDNTGSTTYDPVTGLFQMTSGPTSLQDGTGNIQFIFPETASGDRVMTVQFTYDPADGVIDSAVANDFELIGSIDTNGDYVPDITGVLLTGTILDFSYEDSGTTDIYDYRFEVTGGLLASSFPTGNFAIVNVSENSTFTGDFGVAFSGEGKATLGSVERLEEPEPDPEPEEEPEEDDCERDRERECGDRDRECDDRGDRDRECDDRGDRDSDRGDRNCVDREKNSTSNDRGGRSSKGNRGRNC